MINYILADPTLSWDSELSFSLSFKKFFASEKNLFNIWNCTGESSI